MDVFVDNEREAIDRGYSGRFSSNMGFKYDFEEEQAEDFVMGQALGKLLGVIAYDHEDLVV